MPINPDTLAAMQALQQRTADELRANNTVRVNRVNNYFNLANGYEDTPLPATVAYEDAAQPLRDYRTLYGYMPTPQEEQPRVRPIPYPQGTTVRGTPRAPRLTPIRGRGHTPTEGRQVDNWYVDEYAGAGIEANQSPIDVTVSRDVYYEILTMLDEAINKSLNFYTSLYKKRLDFMENKEYNLFIATFDVFSNSAELQESFDKHYMTLKYLPNLKGSIETEQVISSDYPDLTVLGNMALKKWDVEQSKFKYYPSLKNKIGNNNKEMLDGILRVVNIGKGRVLCPNK